MQAIQYIELDIPFCSLVYGVAPCTASLTSSPPTGTIKCFNSKATCQDPANFTPSDVTLRFAKESDYLPREIDCIPSILEISFTPATISLGENLGTRATLQVTFRDHPHSDTGEGYDKYLADRTYDPYSQGTFWGKFRARQPFLRGRSIRWITGLVGDALVDMETRHFVVESFDGPTPDGKYTLIAKDILKLTDGDRAQAPVMNTGFISADITSASGSLTLLPSGIGNAEYPASGYVTLGGNEVCSFTRSGDTVTLTARGVFGTAAAHKAQDRVQLLLPYRVATPADIIYDLMVNYAGIDASYINFAEWQDEVDSFLGRLYNANICEPTSVATLIGELIQQACLAIWWDDSAQKIRLQVLRGIVTDAATFTPENWLQGSLTVKEQPEKRLSQVWVYFGLINALKPLSETENYRSMSVTIDAQAEEDYGAAVIKKIYSRWIPDLGRTVADRIGAIQLGRYRDPPRRLTFDLQRYAETDVELGIGYRVEAQSIQDATGALTNIPIQITRFNSPPDRFKVEAEEMLFIAPDENLGERLIIIDSNINNIVVRTVYNTLYPEPVSGDVVTVRINAGVIVGSTTTLTPALHVGSFPSGVIINLEISGRIQGKGGQGGLGSSINLGGAGLPGGAALFTRVPINLVGSVGQIWGGGGGGGGGGGAPGNNGGGGGGGGGSGTGIGGGGLQGGGPFASGAVGANGTATTGGAGGAGMTYGPYLGGRGGLGGSPGGAGSAGGNAGGGPPGAGGTAIDGVSFVTTISGPNNILGAQIN